MKNIDTEHLEKFTKASEQFFFVVNISVAVVAMIDPSQVCKV